MLVLAAGTLARALPAQGQTQVVFSRPPTGAFIVSSWVDPEGSDSDMYAYDEFTIASDAAITEVRWRGGYTLGAPYGLVTDFSVTIFESISGGSQPHLGNPQLEDTSPIYLAKYHVGGNAGETPAGTFGGTTMYDYSFVLPAPFQATAGVKYWLRIEASQSTYPDWGIAAGSGGDGQHFRFSTGAAMFQFAPNDTAFTLLAPAGLDTPTVTETPTHTPTPTLTPTATRTPIPCVGDCGPHGAVTVGDLIAMINLARGNADLSACSAGNANGDMQITIDEILAAVKNALDGCGSGQ